MDWVGDRALLQLASCNRRNLRALKREGSKVLIVWECETRKPALLLKKLQRFLSA